MTRLRALFAIVALGLFLPVRAQADNEMSVELDLSKPQIALDDRALLTVTVSGVNAVPEPTVPSVEGLDILFQGRTQSLQIINMNMKSSIVFRYALAPQRTGEFTIGPVQVRGRQRTYESNVVLLKVVEAGQSQPATPSVQNVIVEASINKTDPYLGQQITLLLRFARRPTVRLTNAGYQLPDLSDFWNEGMESKREYLQTIDGKEYMVTELAFPLFPTTAGEVMIGPITLYYDELVPKESSRFDSPFFKDPFGRNLFDDDFFKLFSSEDIVKRSVQTDPVRLRVHRLPEGGQPEGFRGGVGSFSVTSRLSGNEVKVGESVTLTLALSGEGNVRDVPAPELSIDGVKVYEDTPSVNVKNYNDTIVGEKVYKLALVPQQTGKTVIPTISISYFNPQTGRYETASSAPVSLNVLPSENETFVVAKPAAPRGGGEQTLQRKDDILPIHERIGPIERSRTERWVRRLRIVAYPLPIIAYLFCLGIVRHRERLRTDIAYRRSRTALKKAEDHIRKAEDAINENIWDAAFMECSRAVTEYLADKLNVPAGGLTPADIESALSRHGVPPNILKEVVRFLESCDYGRFAPSEKAPGMSRNYIGKARGILEYLEKEESITR